MLKNIKGKRKAERERGSICLW